MITLSLYVQKVLWTMRLSRSVANHLAGGPKQQTVYQTQALQEAMMGVEMPLEWFQLAIYLMC